MSLLWSNIGEGVLKHLSKDRHLEETQKTVLGETTRNILKKSKLRVCENNRYEELKKTN